MNAWPHYLANLLTLMVGLSIIGLTIVWIGRDNQRFVGVARFAAGLAFGVVVLGAFVRLNDAGLGCPDWPGCYGHLTPLQAQPHINAAEQADPLGPVTMAKAWKEMIHRYLAASLGALIIGLAVSAWRGRQIWQRSPVIALALIGVVMLQGAFGAWTVTLLLKPAIVTGHLIGGLLTLSLLLWLALSAGARSARLPAQLKPAATVALIAVIVQIVLGGWVSTNYAALACLDLPLCQGQWLPPMNFSDAFHLVRPLGMTADGAIIPVEALTAMHWTHRLFALIVIAAVGRFAWRLSASAEGKRLGLALFAMLGLQVLLGISNVVFGLPLAVAVAHNAGAAMLLMLLVVSHYRLSLGQVGVFAASPERPSFSGASLPSSTFRS